MSKLFFAALTFAISMLAPVVAWGDRPIGPAWIEASPFATLPAGVRYPEGVAANPATGDVYVGTFDNGEPGASPPRPAQNWLLRIARDGHVLAQKDFGGTPLLGLEYHRGKVYLLNMGASKLQRIDAAFTSATAVEDVASIPSIGAPGPRTVHNPDTSDDTITFGSSGFPAPNAMTFDTAGNVYVSDSFQGAIFRFDAVAACTAPCALPYTLIAHDPLLATAGFPPFGANGLAFNADQSRLYIANTGDNRVLAMDMQSHGVSVFAESVHGADGLLFANGLLWVAANQADQVVALNDHGRVVVRAGEFVAVHDGRPVGLLFPASLALADGWMYVTNLALPLTAAPGDEPEEDVTRWTVSRLRVPR